MLIFIFLTIIIIVVFIFVVLINVVIIGLYYVIITIIVSIILSQLSFLSSLSLLMKCMTRHHQMTRVTCCGITNARREQSISEKRV